MSIKRLHALAVIFLLLVPLNIVMSSRQLPTPNIALIGLFGLGCTCLQVILLHGVLLWRSERSAGRTQKRESEVPIHMRARIISSAIDCVVASIVFVIILVVLRGIVAIRGPVQLSISIVIPCLLILMRDMPGMGIGRAVMRLRTVRPSNGEERGCGLVQSVFRNVPLLCFYSLSLLLADRQLGTDMFLQLAYLLTSAVIAWDIVMLKKRGYGLLDSLTGTRVRRSP